MNDNQNLNNLEVENNIQESSYNQKVTPIPSIDVLKSDTNINNSNNKPSKNNNSSTILLILLFVFLFAFVMGMPYIYEFIQKFESNISLSEKEKEEEDGQEQEEEQEKQVPTTEEETLELTCTSNTILNDNYSLVETEIFNYNSKNLVLSSKIISAYNFTNINDEYNNLVKLCDEDSLKYLTHEGYTMSCSYGESNIKISYEFDLETFTPITDGDTNITANATYQQNIETLKLNLISKGYTCE